MIKRKLQLLLVFICSMLLISSYIVVATTDYGGKIYSIGTSISDGSVHHDNIHSTYGALDDIENSYEYWFDYYMNTTYSVHTNLSGWYTNQSYASSWDIYNIGTGGGQTNNNGGEGNCAAYPYCCHCPPVPAGGGAPYEDAMYMACVPAVIDGTYGRQTWRWQDRDWSTISYVIVESGVNEAMDHEYFSDVGGEAYAQHIIRGSVWSGMNGVYNQSITYGFKFVLLKTIPYSTPTYGQIYVDIVNEEKDKFAAMYPDVLYIDTFNTSMVTWTVPYTTWNYNSAYYDDTAHPNKAGYQLLGDLIADAVFLDMNVTYSPPRFISINGQNNGTSIYDSTPTFNWTKINNTLHYWLQVSTDTSFTTLVVNLSNISADVFPSNYAENTTSVSFTLPSEYMLSDYGTFYCRVRASRGG